jgi:DNA-binding MurR/RpiR family transcriptional regulator
LADEKDCSIVLIADSLINPLTPFADFTLCAGIGRDEGSVLADTCAPSHLLYMMSRRMAEKYPQQTADFQSTSFRRYEEFVT